MNDKFILITIQIYKCNLKNIIDWEISISQLYLQKLYKYYYLYLEICIIFEKCTYPKLMVENLSEIK